MISPATATPDTEKIGPEALRRTCLRITYRSGMPRPRAVCTCSEPSSARTADRVTCVT